MDPLSFFFPPIQITLIFINFTFIKTSDFVENTQELEVKAAPANSILTLLKWIILDFIKVFSDLGNFPELIKELTGMNA